jgi:EpsG family
VLIYWALFGYFAAGALLAPSGGAQARSRPFLALGAVVTGLLIGLRYRVGADWDTYAYWFSYAGRGGFDRLLKFGDLAYQFLNWGFAHGGLEIWAVNLVCGAIFSWGLWRFCKAQPEPWLAFAVAIPYIAIVIAMGYTRQGVALGILMAGLASFQRNSSTVRFAVYVAVAALFHKTAVVAFPLVALASPRNRLLNLLLVIATSYLLYGLFLGDAMEQFVQHYITQTRYSSQGAGIRIAMTLFAALVLWITRRQLGLTETEWRLWRNFSLAAVAALVLLFVLPSSTAVDRISVYLMPLQLAVLSRVPIAIRSELPGRAAVIGYSALVQFVWFNYAQFSRLWVPYQFYPF